MEDNIYVLSDGRVRRVPADQDQAFQTELKDKGLTAVIQSDMSGNQISSMKDASIEQKEEASNLELDQTQINQKKDTELQSVDGSLEPPITSEIPEIDPWQSFKNNLSNSLEMVGDVKEFWFLEGFGNKSYQEVAEEGNLGARSGLSIASTLIWESIFGREKLKKYVEKNPNFLQAGTSDSEIFQKTIENFEKEREDRKQTMTFKEADSLADYMSVAAGAVVNAGGSVVYNLGTLGTGFFMDFASDNFIEANKIKAKSKGKTLDQLLKDDEADVAAPIKIAAFQTGLELFAVGKILRPFGGGKTIARKIAKKISNSKAARIALDIFSTGNVEAVTEGVQYGLEYYNKELAKAKSEGKDINDLATIVDGMLSDEGLENAAQGFFGGAGLRGAGYSAKAASQIRKNVDELDIEKDLNSLVSLRKSYNNTKDEDVRAGLEVSISNIEKNIKNKIKKGNEIYNSLSEEGISEIEKLGDLSDMTAYRINQLNEKLENNSISKQQHQVAIEGLTIKFNEYRNKILSTINTKKVKSLIEEGDLKGSISEVSSSEIENMNLKDDKGNDISKQAAGNFGFIKQFKDGSFEIFLNKDKPAVGTAAHEFLHAVLFSTLDKNKNIQNELASSLLDYTSTLKSEGDQNFVNRINAYKDSKALGEEVITVMSESTLDGSLKYNEGFFTKIGDSVRRFVKGTLGIEYKFDTGRDVYNFIKDYNNTIKTGKVNKAIIKVAKEGARGKLVDKAKKGEDTKQDVVIKESKDAKPAVDNLAVDPKTKKNYTQSEWNRVGAKRAIDTLKKRGLMDGLIASKYKIKLDQNELQSFVANVLGSTEFINMINRFNRGKRNTPDENDSLFGYIQGQLRFRADDVFKEAERGKVPKGTRVRELDARTPEGQQKVQLEDTGDTTIERIDEQEINLRDEITYQTKPEVQERKSTFRREIGLTRKGKVFREVKKALRVAESIVNPKKFLNTFEKTTSDSLFEFMKTFFPDTNSMVKYRVAILESIPVTTLTQMQKMLPEKIFVKSYGRLTNKAQIADFVNGTNMTGKNPGKKKLLPKSLLDDSDVSKKKRAAGVAVYERLKPTSTQWKNYLEATDRGKRQTAARSGTKGNNRIKILEEAAKAISKDATPEILTSDFLQDYIQEKGLQSSLTVEQVKKEILKTIDRPADLKFSVDPKVQAENFKKAANKKPNDIVSDRGVTNLEVVNKIQEYKSAKSGKIKSRTIVDFIKSSKLSRDIKKHMGGFLSTHPKYIPYFQDSMTGGYDNGLFGIKNIFYSIVGIKDTNIKKDLRREKYSKTGGLLDVNKMNKFKNNQGKHIASNKARIDFLEGLIKDMYTYVKANPESKPAMVMFFKDGSKHQNHVLRYLAPIVGAPTNTKGKFLEVKIKEEHGYPQNQVNTIILDLLLNDNTNIKSIDDAVKVFRSSYSQWGLIETHDNQIDDAKLTTSMPEYFYNDIVPRIIKGEFDNLPQGILGPIIRYIESGVPIGSYYLFEVNKTVAEYFGVNVKNASDLDMEHLAPIQNELIKQILLGNITKAKAKQQMKNVVGIGHKNTVAENKTNNNIIDAFNKQAKFIKKQNEEIQRDLEKRGYKFLSSKDGTVKGQTPSEMIRIIEEDLRKRGYTFSGTVSSSEPSRIRRGMSTFDFDETLIIDGENFVVATDPKTGETINIMSGDWPIRGPELAAAGYTFNFDDFVNVRGGVEGPLLQKMRNQIQKYGVNNVFVLTARPQTADSAIRGWLKSKGIDIPMKNITGLGDSRGDAKAEWMLEKFSEGYNDMYFVDDALPNVKAVKKVLEQLDVKSKVVQAKIKFSATASQEFNKIIEESKGVKADRVISQQEALKMGRGKNWFRIFVPPSAEDFKGLLYRFLGKGRQGDRHAAWFKQNLLDPFAKGIRAWNTYKQNIATEYKTLKKKMPQVKKLLNKKVGNTVFTVDSAIRVYLWDKAGYDIPGITPEIKAKLIKYVNDNPEVQSFADALSVISRVKEGYSQPSENWSLQSITTDLDNIVNKVGRKEFLREFLDNVEAIFTPDNMNKIEALYGAEFREALENILFRMENGTNRLQSNDRVTNAFLGWINGSIGAIMFFNTRSVLLQTLSTVNFLNFSDNNVFKAARRFANQVQFWKDFAMLFNSDQLKQRRAGLQTDVSASELTKTFSEGGTTMIDKANSVIKYLLQLGFTPTQLADSFAIALGGASFYRNRFNTYKKRGLSDAKAKEQAMLDFQEIAEETQQSSREDLISQQQASTLGRLILAFQNVTMQYTRYTKKRLSDLVNRRRIKGYTQIQSDMSNISAIIYYGAVQNIIFGALQSALIFVLFGKDDDEDEIDEKVERVANGALDSLLRGTGIFGAIIATIKNVALRYQKEKQKGWGRDDGRVILEALQLSPPIGSKFRKIYSAMKTEQYNPGVSKEIGFRIENPNLVALANVIEATTNLPAARIQRKANNVEEAVTGQHSLLQRVALFSGWSLWDIGAKDEELEAAKKAAKEKIRKQKQKGKVRCTAIKSSGGRCKNTTRNKNKRCYAHQ